MSRRQQSHRFQRTQVPPDPKWSEHFAAKPETLRKLNYAVDKFDLRPHMRAHGLIPSECTPAAEEARVDAVIELLLMVLLPKARPWLPGYNSNVEGHYQVRYLIYNEGELRYR